MRSLRDMDYIIWQTDSSDAVIFVSAWCCSLASLSKNERTPISSGFIAEPLEKKLIKRVALEIFLILDDDTSLLDYLKEHRPEELI